MTATIRVGERHVGAGHPVFIVAEIGASHGGDVGTALQLVEEAGRRGVDAVKLQTINVDESYVPGEPSHEIFKSLWFNMDELRQIQHACRQQGIELFSTPGDFYSLDVLLELGIPLIKISSGLMTNLPLVRRAAASGVPLVISTGMSYLEEVQETVRAAEQAGCRQLMLMHCVSLYPAPAESLNLAAMTTLAGVFPYPVGYSDHYDGVAACWAAVSMGARLLEKHFTLDRARRGPDDHFSADPAQMRELVRGVREVERMIGSAEKRPVEAELPGRGRYRRCLVARRRIAAGEKIGVDAIALKRPRAGQQGLEPALLEAVIGQRALRDIAANESLTAELVDMGAR